LSAIGSTVKTGLGLGLLLGILDSLKNIFSENQQVVDLMNQAMVVMQGAINGVIEVLKPLFTWLGKAFQDPKKWWDDLVQSFKDGAAWIKTNMIDGVLNKFTEWANSAKIAVLELRKAWNEFTGDTEEAEKIGKQIDELTNKTLHWQKRTPKRWQTLKELSMRLLVRLQMRLIQLRKQPKKHLTTKMYWRPRKPTYKDCKPFTKVLLKSMI
jgi:vesicle coat complex subunit